MKTEKITKQNVFPNYNLPLSWLCPIVCGVFVWICVCDEYCFFDCSRSCTVLHRNHFHSSIGILSSLSLSHTEIQMLHTALFAYGSHLEIVVLVIRQGRRKHNYGTSFHLVTGRLCECACVYGINSMFHRLVCKAQNLKTLHKPKSGFTL